jgi:hypothetical protein
MSFDRRITGNFPALQWEGEEKPIAAFAMTKTIPLLPPRRTLI